VKRVEDAILKGTAAPSSRELSESWSEGRRRTGRLNISSMRDVGQGQEWNVFHRIPFERLKKELITI